VITTMMRPCLYSLLALIAAFALMGQAGSAQQFAKSANIERGRTLYTDVGCYQCHGFNGQGAPGAGPALVPDPMAAAAFRTQVRTPRALMPAYGTAILPDNQLDDIYAYMASIPVGRAPDRIPLLTVSGAQPAPARPANVAAGKVIYASYCAACHGANRDGLIGASLHTQEIKRSLQSTLDLIKTPPPGMTKLYPAVLSDMDVANVAAYIRQSP
jgi:mono/diheme cytochrome c family protein